MLKPFETSTLSGKVWKDSILAETLGSVDEANAFIGLARVLSRKDEIKAALKDLQLILFRVCAVIAGDKNPDNELNKILSMIESFEGKVEKPNCFLILEKDEGTSALSVARAVVRRAERRAISLYRNGLLSEKIVEVLNKISYLLYLLILYEGESFEEVKF
jgi:cob(I)alamin adenosyltransferase